MASLLWLILMAVLIVWLVGLVANVAGAFIHVLLVVALAILIVNLLSGRRRV